MTTAKRVFQAYPDWTTDFCQQYGFFQHLNTLFDFAHWTQFPCVSTLNGLLKEGTTTLSGQSIKFVDQDEIDFDGRAYETVIYQTGQIPTRKNSWHDLFGALIWCLMPKTKALLNQMHHQDILSFGLKTRTATRNAITLFDECGVLIATCNEQLPNQLRQHQWRACFVNQREQWGKQIAPFIFGHANYEMLTKPYIGLTGKALSVTVDAKFFTLSLLGQYQYLDRTLAAQIGQQQLLADNRYLSPLPLLGIPGWYRENEDPSFYDNTAYFRALPQKYQEANDKSNQPC